MLLALIAISLFTGAAPEPTAQQELQAAKLVEAALFARRAETSALQKLDQIYNELNRKYPADSAVKNAHAEFLWKTGKQAPAMERWVEAEKLNPKNAVILDHLAGGYLAAGDMKKSAAFYDRATESEPGNPLYHFKFANVLFLFRHHLVNPAQPTADDVLARALRHFSEASRLDPLNPDYARAYGETFYTIPKPDWKAALAAWERFLETTPQKDFALLNLARVHMKLGQKTEARERLERIQSAEYQRLKARLGERIDSEP